MYRASYLRASLKTATAFFGSFATASERDLTVSVPAAESFSFSTYFSAGGRYPTCQSTSAPSGPRMSSVGVPETLNRRKTGVPRGVPFSARKRTKFAFRKSWNLGLAKTC